MEFDKFTGEECSCSLYNYTPNKTGCGYSIDTCKRCKKIRKILDELEPLYQIKAIKELEVLENKKEEYYEKINDLGIKK